MGNALQRRVVVRNLRETAACMNRGRHDFRRAFLFLTSFLTAAVALTLTTRTVTSMTKIGRAHV